MQNCGNIHRSFQNSDQLVATASAFPHFTVLGEATRVVEATWETPPRFCVCTIEVHTGDGQGNTIAASTRVIVFPLQLTIGILLATAGLALLLIARRRRQADHLHQQLDQARQEGAQAAVNAP